MVVFAGDALQDLIHLKGCVFATQVYNVRPQPARIASNTTRI